MTSTIDSRLDDSSFGPRSLDGQEGIGKRQQRLVLVAVLTALIAVVASMSGLNVAQQQIAVDLGASQSGVLWIINAYTLVLAALLMPIGGIGDRWGRKPVLLVGIVIFFVSNIIAMTVATTATMILARVFAGIGASMIMPVTLSVITSSFPAEDRARAIGIWAGFAGSGGMIGLFVSSFMVDVLSWRWTYVLPIVLVVTSAAITVRFVPNSRESSLHPFDVVGSVLSALAIGGVVLGIHEGPERGWSDSLTVAGLVVGSVALIGFIVWERQVTAPLLDLSAFRDRGLAAGSLTLVVLFSVMFGTLLVLFPYLQAVLGWSALKSAVSVLPMAAVMMPVSTIAPRIAIRIGSRNTMLIGVGIFLSGLVLLAVQASVEGGYLSVLPGLMAFGLGLGLTMTPATSAITETLPLDKQGVASALNDTSREIGGAIGVALLGSVLSAGYRSSIEANLDGVPERTVELASEGIGSAYAVATDAGSRGAAIIDAAQHALVDGWRSSMWVAMVLALGVFVFLAVRGPENGPSAGA
ncbi:MAG: MFS transporter [Actinomycetota bacterium]